jgi:hypothetical protein
MERIKPAIYVLKRHVVLHVTGWPLFGCRTAFQEVWRRSLKLEA